MRPPTDQEAAWNEKGVEMNTQGRSIASLSRMQQKPKVGRKVFGDAIFKEEIDWEHVIPELEKHIAKTDSAKAALDTVVRATGDRDQVLRKLYNFGGGSPELARAVKAAFSQRRKYILEVSDNMREVAGEIEKAHKYLSDMGLVVHSDRTNTLRLDADFLKRLADTIVKDLATKRLSGRDQHLVFLAKMIELKTGRKYHRELAELVDAVRSIYDSNYKAEHTADSIRKLVDRYGLLDFESALELADVRTKHEQQRGGVVGHQHSRRTRRKARRKRVLRRPSR